MELIGTRIRALREARGLSRTKLCRQTGLQRWSLRQWEAGRCLPRPASLRLLADGLGVTTHFILYGYEDHDGFNRRLAGIRRALLDKSKSKADCLAMLV